MLSLLFAFLYLTNGEELENTTLGIVRGSAVDQATMSSTYPWMVNPSGCTATLITPTWAITAAHCGTPSRVTLGSTQRSGSGGRTVTVSQAIRHPSYNNRAMQFDVMLLRLSSSQSTRTVPLYGVTYTSRINFLGNDGSVIGWGQQGEYIGPPSTLHRARVGIQSRSSQRDMIEILGHGSGNSRTGVCYGDSGGPLLWSLSSSSYVQLGMVSWGPYPCENGIAYYASSEFNAGWINSVIGGRFDDQLINVTQPVLQDFGAEDCMTDKQVKSFEDHLVQLRTDLEDTIDKVSSGANPDHSEDQLVFLVIERVSSDTFEALEDLTNMLYDECPTCAEAHSILDKEISDLNEFMNDIDPLWYRITPWSWVDTVINDMRDMPGFAGCA